VLYDVLVVSTSNQTNKPKHPEKGSEIGISGARADANRSTGAGNLVCGWELLQSPQGPVCCQFLGLFWLGPQPLLMLPLLLLLLLLLLFVRLGLFNTVPCKSVSQICCVACGAQQAATTTEHLPSTNTSRHVIRNTSSHFCTQHRSMTRLLRSSGGRCSSIPAIPAHTPSAVMSTLPTMTWSRCSLSLSLSLSLVSCNRHPTQHISQPSPQSTSCKKSAPSVVCCC